MAKKATRIGDSTSGTCDIKAECCPHDRSGTNNSGSENVFFNSKNAHRLGDSGSCNCPHNGNFISDSGSNSVFINGKKATRAGDSTICQACNNAGSHVSGSDNIFIGD